MDVSGSLFNMLASATREHTEGTDAVPVGEEAGRRSDDDDDEEEEMEEVRRGSERVGIIAWAAANSFL
jgi:hypothetical protein